MNPTSSGFIHKHPRATLAIPAVPSVPRNEIAPLFYDWNHLGKAGHRLWGDIIGADLKKMTTDMKTKGSS